MRGPAYRALPRDANAWVIEDLVPVGGLVNFFAPPKAAKSFAALGMALAVAHPSTAYWADRFAVHKHGPVLIVQLDTPRQIWGDRMAAIAAAGYDDSNIFTVDLEHTPTMLFDIMNRTDQAWLRAEITNAQPVLIVIDTLRDLHRGDENDATVMMNAIGELKKVVNGIATVLISHTRKGSKDGEVDADTLIDNARGSSSIAGKMDNLIQICSASRLAWKGRKGQGEWKFARDPHTGLLVDATPKGELEILRIKEQMRLTPEASDRRIAKDVAALLALPDARVETLRKKVASLRLGIEPDPYEGWTAGAASRAASTPSGEAA